MPHWPPRRLIYVPPLARAGNRAAGSARTPKGSLRLNASWVLRSSPSCGLVRPVRPNIFWPKRCGGDGPRPVRLERPVRRVRPNIICIIWSKKYDGDRSARCARCAWSAQIYFGPKGTVAIAPPGGSSPPGPPKYILVPKVQFRCKG